MQWESWYKFEIKQWKKRYLPISNGFKMEMWFSSAFFLPFGCWAILLLLSIWLNKCTLCSLQRLFKMCAVFLIGCCWCRFYFSLSETAKMILFDDKSNYAFAALYFMIFQVSSHRARKFVRFLCSFFRSCVKKRSRKYHLKSISLSRLSVSDLRANRIFFVER